VGGPSPPLWRFARVLRILGYLVLAVVIVFVGTAIYFAVHATPSFQTGSNSATLDSSNSTVEYTQGLNLTNPGIYAISNVGLSGEIRLPNGSLVASGGSPILTVAPASTTALPIHLWVPLRAGGDVLLTHNVPLTEEFWANATFASLFVLHFNDTKNSTWGAPFYQFNATPGNPQPQSNGTVAVPVSLDWQNGAPFGEVGTVVLQVVSSEGQVCASNSLGVDVAAGSSAGYTPTFYLGPACDPSGGSVLATYTGNGLTYAFPPEAIP
jgi:hypothetical protein